MVECVWKKTTYLNIIKYRNKIANIGTNMTLSYTIIFMCEQEGEHVL